MAVMLIVLNGSHAGQEIRVRQKKYLIGRSDDCHLRPRSDQISRHHCALLVDEPDVLVRDLGSRNGTYVNGKRINGACVLSSGDLLQVGRLELRVTVTSLRRTESASDGETVGETVTDWLGADPVGDTNILDDRDLQQPRPDLAGPPPPHRHPLARYRQSERRQRIDALLKDKPD